MKIRITRALNVGLSLLISSVYYYLRYSNTYMYYNSIRYGSKTCIKRSHVKGIIGTFRPHHLCCWLQNNRKLHSFIYYNSPCPACNILHDSFSLSLNVRLVLCKSSFSKYSQTCSCGNQ
jgi:hypothetical protein